MAKTRILSPEEIHQKIERLAWQIYENHVDEKEIFLAGIDKNGYTLAKKIIDVLERICDLKITLVKVGVDKKSPLSEEVKVDMPLNDLQDRCVVLVDDVLNSGKTLIYGVRPFLAIRLKKLTTAVLVDRNHKRYPIKADVKGLSLSTSLHENVDVDFTKKGGVYLL